MAMRSSLAPEDSGSDGQARAPAAAALALRKEMAQLRQLGGTPLPRSPRPSNTPE